MKKHQITIDIEAGGITPMSVDPIEVSPGRFYYAAYDQSLRPIDGESLFCGERFIRTAWHDEPAAARAEAAEELARRAEQLARLHEACMSGQEVANG